MFHLSLTQVSIQVNLTKIHGFISFLHNRPIYARDQTCSHHHTAQQPQHALADSIHHIVEKEEVIEAVERLPEDEKEEPSSYCIVQIYFEIRLD